MKIIIHQASMVPIYEQIVDQIKQGILLGELKKGDALPSVRALSKELKISALTVKKAYDYLESECFIQTVHGKGSFISEVNQELKQEEIRKNIENELEIVINKAIMQGITKEELKTMFDCLVEE